LNEAVRTKQASEQGGARGSQETGRATLPSETAISCSAFISMASASSWRCASSANASASSISISAMPPSEAAAAAAAPEPQALKRAALTCGSLLTCALRLPGLGIAQYNSADNTIKIEKQWDAVGQRARCNS